MEVVVLPGMQEIGGTVKIAGKLTDNAGLEKDNIKFDLTYPDGTTDNPSFEYENNIFSYTFQSPDNLSEDMENPILIYLLKLTFI